MSFVHVWAFSDFVLRYYITVLWSLLAFFVERTDKAVGWLSDVFGAQSTGHSYHLAGKKKVFLA